MLFSARVMFAPSPPLPAGAGAAPVAVDEGVLSDLPIRLGAEVPTWSMLAEAFDNYRDRDLDLRLDLDRAALGRLASEVRDLRARWVALRREEHLRDGVTAPRDLAAGAGVQLVAD